MGGLVVVGVELAVRLAQRCELAAQPLDLARQLLLGGLAAAALVLDLLLQRRDLRRARVEVGAQRGDLVGARGQARAERDQLVVARRQVAAQDLQLAHGVVGHR